MLHDANYMNALFERMRKPLGIPEEDIIRFYNGTQFDPNEIINNMEVIANKIDEKFLGVEAVESAGVRPNPTTNAESLSRGGQDEGEQSVRNFDTSTSTTREKEEEDFRLYQPIAKEITDDAQAHIAFEMFFGRRGTKEEIENFKDSHLSYDRKSFQPNSRLKNPLYRLRLWFYRRFVDKD